MLKKIYDKAIKVSGEVGSNHVGAYAAQSAYFFILCMIPIILLLLTMVQYTPVTKADVMTAVVQVFPTTVDSLIVSIVNQVYNQSTSVIPITSFTESISLNLFSRLIRFFCGISFTSTIENDPIPKSFDRIFSPFTVSMLLGKYDNMS